MIERIKVLAVAQDVSNLETKPKVVNAVTLEVTPAQAEKIDLARSIGSLSLVLRSQVDMKSVSTVGARKNDLLETAESTLGNVSSALGSVFAGVKPPAAKPPKTNVRAAMVPPQNTAPAPETTEVIRGLNKTTE